MKKINIVTALTAIIGVPALLLLQQWCIAGMKKQPPRVNKLFAANAKLMAHTESGLDYSPRKAHHTASAAVGYMNAGDWQRAENWLKLGAMIHRYPSMMLFYGDYLVRFRRYREAARWYALAADQGRKAGQYAFADVAAKRVAALKNMRKGR